MLCNTGLDALQASSAAQQRKEVRAPLPLVPVVKHVGMLGLLHVGLHRLARNGKNTRKFVNSKNASLNLV